MTSLSSTSAGHSQKAIMLKFVADKSQLHRKSNDEIDLFLDANEDLNKNVAIDIDRSPGLSTMVIYQLKSSTLCSSLYYPAAGRNLVKSGFSSAMQLYTRAEKWRQ